MFHRFFRHIKEGFLGVRRHIGMALSSASAVTITLLLVGLFLLLSANLAVLSKDIEDSISLVALLSRDVTAEAEINSISDKIHAVQGVANVDYRTKDQEFDFYNEQYPDMAEFSDLYRDSNPFHDAFLITVTDGEVLKDVKNEISQIRGVESVMDGGDQTYVLIDILKNARIVGGALVILLASAITPMMPYLLAFAAGAMLYVGVEELGPEASQGEHSNIATIGFAVGFALMMVLDVVMG